MSDEHDPCLTASEILAYLDGELPEGRKAEVDRHLDGCRLCEAAVEGVAGLEWREGFLTEQRRVAEPGSGPHGDGGDGRRGGAPGCAAVPVRAAVPDAGGDPGPRRGRRDRPDPARPRRGPVPTELRAVPQHAAHRPRRLDRRRVRRAGPLRGPRLPRSPRRARGPPRARAERRCGPVLRRSLPARPGRGPARRHSTWSQVLRLGDEELQAPAEWYLALAHLRGPHPTEARHDLERIAGAGGFYRHKARALLAELDRLEHRN